uniref:probable BOI-related E3 ubiquitin-protein ligase 2 n=1 Tax=Erigeron canadensis TaxID=72917 RepID=UPI001CB8A93A|nr:probable BOI-related E3 ubiquitin-protein ligase 2 [Erigeron canadensis]
MAVEAANHLTLFSPQFLLNKHSPMAINTVNNQPSTTVVNNLYNCNYINPISAAADTLLPMYSAGFTENDSGLTYSTLPVSRKRSRDSDSYSSMYPFSNGPIAGNRNLNNCRSHFTFLGEDISSQIQQQQLEIDQFVAIHTEKVRAEIEDRRKRNSRTIIAALEENITQKLRAKEDEITKMRKLNYALEEKVKSLSIENQIWREVAQTNEATANSLRFNLKQVLEQVVYNEYNKSSGCDADVTVLSDDAQSCCESNNYENACMLPEQDSGNSNERRLMCKSCGKQESCVLLLPCRHLCLCTVCASSVDTCLICKSPKNISVHVHMS